MYTTKQLRTDFKKGPYAWPGGYEFVWITTDGSLLCNSCLVAEKRNVLESMRDRQSGHDFHTGWEIDGFAIIQETFDSFEEAESLSLSIDFCVHCNRALNLNN